MGRGDPKRRGIIPARWSSACRNRHNVPERSGDLGRTGGTSSGLGTIQFPNRERAPKRALKPGSNSLISLAWETVDYAIVRDRYWALSLAT